MLREIAAPVAVVDDQIRKLAADMIDAMGYFNGIGLAAPQITYLVQALRARGIMVSEDVTTVEEAKEEILKLWRK